MLGLGTVPWAAAKATNTSARPHGALALLQHVGQMRGVTGAQHWRRSVPGCPSVPPALISSRSLAGAGRHGWKS